LKSAKGAAPGGVTLRALSMGRQNSRKIALSWL
jgi:hypothetical protein